jgi:hypothetical protein
MLHTQQRHLAVEDCLHQQVTKGLPHEHTGDREKPGATPPSLRMSPSLLDTNAIALNASPHSKRGSALGVKDGTAVGPSHLLFLHHPFAHDLIDG